MPSDAMHPRPHTERPVPRRRRARRPLPPLPVVPSPSGFRTLGQVLAEAPDRAPSLRPQSVKALPWHVALARILARKLGRGAQSEVARRINRTPQQVQRWASGVKEPSVSNLLRVLDAAGSGLCELEREMRGEGEEAPSVVQRRG